MNRTKLHRLAALVAVGMLAGAVAGCGGKTASKTGDENAAKGADTSKLTETEQADLKALPEKQRTNLEKLPLDDLKLALAQKKCPVSGDPLGDMGTPEVVSVKGEKVLICCDGCRKDVEENPDKYIAMVKESREKDKTK